uniref:Uncharacterized protein n=1 Tax=viral metagenome TaxID=1070528 RepID=A0A6C0DVV6_9ZZZZ
MNLQNEFVACIRKTADGWSDFEQTVRTLPKHRVYSLIPTVGTTMDSRVFAGVRRPSEEAARWATYTAIMALFTASTHDWLLILEEDSSIDLTKIPETPANGVTILGPGAVLLDRISARAIIRNLRMFYAPLNVMLQDLKTLQVFDVTILDLSVKRPTNLHVYGPLLLGSIAAVTVGLLICPPNSRFWSKQLVGATEVLAPKEALIGGKG